MGLLELVRFGVDLVHIFALAVVYVVGLTIQTAYARLRKAWRSLRTTMNRWPGKASR